MAVKPAVSLLVFTLLSTPVLAGPSKDPLSDPVQVLKKAEEAVKRLDRKRADFYAARWLALCEKTPAACPQGAFEPFLKERKLEPKAFLPGDWDPSFIDWFEKSPRAMWGAESGRVREQARSFEIAQATWNGRYFVTVVAYPQLELWHLVKDGLISHPITLPMGSFKDRPTVFFGKTLRGRSIQTRSFFLNTQKRMIHTIWNPEFFDVDGDGFPEVWLRFNLSWGNGFAQVLDVYRIREESELVLLRRFQGVEDGVARRLPDGSVEVAVSKRTDARRHVVETWRFEDKEFKKAAEKEVPYILTDPRWREAYSPA